MRPLFWTLLGVLVVSAVLTSIALLGGLWWTAAGGAFTAVGAGSSMFELWRTGRARRPD
ncbi:hypothetical protein ACOACO_12550 [Nocardioides sp. CPCC 205120]|uniref:hypothetical protein n=1 Tax=Nocardioides sp. CPCC 205120 TaxID=3406462 RepID=UPI003B50C55E